MARPYIKPEDYYNTVGVEDYYDKIHRTTWARRTAGLLTGGTLGMLTGGIIGALGACLPYALFALGVSGAALPAMGFAALLATSAATCAMIGSAIGVVLVCDVSSNSAAMAAGLEEMEKRHKVEQLQNGQAVHGTAPAVPDDKPTTATISPRAQLFNWKVSLVTATMFAVFGAIIACTPAAIPAAFVGLAAHTPAAIMASAAMFGMFGAQIGVKNSLITNKVNNFFFKLLTDQYFDHPEKAKPMNLQPVVARDTVPALEVAAPERKTTFAADLTAQREQAPAERAIH